MDKAAAFKLEGNMQSKKNVVLLVIDSLGNYNRRKVEDILLPFMSGLKKESIYYPNMFSEAPYTEAALISMLCGKDTLADEGYFYRFDKSYNLFEYFQENGYEVYNYIQPHVYPSSILKGNSHFYYNVSYDFNAVWNYRLGFYANLHQNGELNEEDYKKIRVLLDDNLDFGVKFYETLLSNDESFSLVNSNIRRVYTEEYLNEQLNLLMVERKKYIANKNQYIVQLLEQQKEHVLFTVGVLEQSIKVSDTTRNWIKENYKETFQQIYRLNKKSNFKLNKINWSSIWFDFIETLRRRGSDQYEDCLKHLKGNLAYWRNSIYDRDLMDRVFNSDSFKASPSLDSHIKHFEQKLVERDNKSPFFSCIHVDDLHDPEIFYTYDTDDLDVLKKELDDIKKVIKELPNDLTGSYSYYLSLAYIDKKIQYLFEVLEKQGVLQDTIVMITGDHGFAFDYVHIRNSCVNNHYLENYNVPFYIYNYKNENFIDTRLCSSKDILPTVLDMFDFVPMDGTITGHSLFSQPSDYVILQNVMGGCPDIDNRSVSIGILTSKELVVGESSLESHFENVELVEYFNLQKDPYQKNNIIKKEKGLENREIVKILKKEFLKLYKNVEENNDI